jgi:type II secretory pathway pseudopilin PulG
LISKVVTVRTAGGTSSATQGLRSHQGVNIRKAQGFALIDLVFVCGIIGVLCSVALPSLLQARQTAGAASAIGSMRAITSGELTFALTCGAGFYAPNLKTLGTAPPGSHEPFVSGGLGAADTVVKSAYQIQLSATPYASAPLSCNGLAEGEGGQGFKAAADPLESLNKRHFATNANNVIFEDVASLWPVIPEIGVSPSGHSLR